MKETSCLSCSLGSPAALTCLPPTKSVRHRDSQSMKTASDHGSIRWAQDYGTERVILNFMATIPA